MTLRRRIASIILLVGAVLLITRFVGHRDELVPVVIVYDLGERQAERLEAIVRRPGTDDELARFVRHGASEKVRQKTRLRPGDYEIEIVVVGGGEPIRTRRTIQVHRDAVITVRLADAG